MPVHPLTADWSDPISLQSGDIIQNQGGYAIEVTPADPATDPARLLLPGYGGAMQVDSAVTIRARCLVGGGVLHVVRGF